MAYKATRIVPGLTRVRLKIINVMLRELRTTMRNSSSGSGCSVQAPVKKNSKDGSETTDLQDNPQETKCEKKTSVHWPADLLPSDCPNARILVYGYDTSITKYFAGPTNKNSIVSHSKDLLFTLSRVRTQADRPLILIAHSLGGIVLKEMFFKSYIATLSEHRSIASSVAALIFLGTPHRGSPELAALGEWARSLASGIRMESNPAILNALGLKTDDLQRAQENFSVVWNKYDFRVKTFQEAKGLTGIKLGVFGNKVVPDYSSLLGDSHENAETLSANHMDMCRFYGIADANYVKVAGELRSVYNWLTQEKKQMTGSDERVMPIRTLAPHCQATRARSKQVLDALWFPQMQRRLQSIQKPETGTCEWLFEHIIFQDWINDRSQDKSCRILCLQGYPGSGKSVLMKEAFRRVALKQNKPDYCVAAFFCSNAGLDGPSSNSSVFRSLLYQFGSKDEVLMAVLLSAWDQINSLYSLQHAEHMDGLWIELGERFFELLVNGTVSPKRLVVFVDAIDECEARDSEAQLSFWRSITMLASAKGVSLSVCYSTRNRMPFGSTDAQRICVEHHNDGNIELYIDQRLGMVVRLEVEPWRKLKKRLLEKSAGVFLWTALVIDDLLLNFEGGESSNFLLKRLEVVPQGLSELFRKMLEPDGGTNHATRNIMLHLLQWATCSTRPLRLREWRHVMALILDPEPSGGRSLKAWRASDALSESDEHLERRIKHISKGLVEIQTLVDESIDTIQANVSISAKAGSLNLEHGESRMVQVIHQSVRDFFVNDDGFRWLQGSLEPSIGSALASHLSIARMCLQYLGIEELDSLVQARCCSKPRTSIDSESSYSKAPDAYSKAQFDKVSDRAEQSNETSNDRIVPSGAKFHIAKPTPYETTSSHMMSSGDEPLIVPDGEIEVFQVLRDSFSSVARIDIAEWQESGNFSCGQEHMSTGQDNVLKSLSRDTNQTRLLEDYPALLSYASFMVFAHLRLARDAGAVVTGFALEVPIRTWGRFLALREDIPANMDIWSYAKSEGLAEIFEMPHETGPIVKEHGEDAARIKAKRSREEEIWEDLSKIVRRYNTHNSWGGSVVSFGSASDYSDSQSVN